MNLISLSWTLLKLKLKTTKNWAWTRKLQLYSTWLKRSRLSWILGTVVKWRKVCSLTWTTYCLWTVWLLCTALLTLIKKARAQLSSSVCQVQVRLLCLLTRNVCWSVMTNTDGMTKVYSTSKVVATLKLSTWIKKANRTSGMLSNAMLCWKTVQLTLKAKSTSLTSQ